jgi:hypothetical protein
LILDGHNSHCTFTFCKYAADNKIIIICLPSHTTHALQPCDVGAFGPLAQSWKREVTLASQSLIAIRKDNLLAYYHTARVDCIESPRQFNQPSEKLEYGHKSSRNPSFQPLSHQKHNYTGCTAPSCTSPFYPSADTHPNTDSEPQLHQPATATLHMMLPHTETDTAEELPDDDEEPMERYHIEVPSTTSRYFISAST